MNHKAMLRLRRDINEGQRSIALFRAKLNQVSEKEIADKVIQPIYIQEQVFEER